MKCSCISSVHGHAFISNAMPYVSQICFIKCTHTLNWQVINYPLFADVDTGIYPHAASQYHARPKAKHGIVMLSVHKFQYPRKQTKGNEFVPCSKCVYHTLKRFHSFKTPAIPFILPKSSYKLSLARSHRGSKAPLTQGCDLRVTVVQP